MTLEEMKQIIEQRAGIPAALLKGETPEEIAIRAKALLAYKRESEAERIKPTREQFAEWLGTQTDAFPLQAEPPTDATIDSIEAAAGGYPRTRDGGEAITADRPTGDNRSTAEQFTEWFKNQTAFDPHKGEL